ncbi:hypothetical protein [Burkholderia pseudomallei]|uniref:hypothetical protein n=1 Tax=Burkholderia pseudomallei TaxID=28450 RepID=UPI0021165DCD|nr:hypothetical protein [Burkholderia pseudomallei]
MTTDNSRADALTERDYDLHEHEQGLYRKFDVRRVDGSSEPGGKHHDCEYFVLDMTHDQHARAALRAYADACASTHPELSADLIARYALAPIEQPAAAPIDDARECLMDVVSHHHDFVTACKSIKGELHACGAHDSAAYWQKQIDVLDRMKAQAERALATSANETGAEGAQKEAVMLLLQARDELCLIEWEGEDPPERIHTLFDKIEAFVTRSPAMAAEALAEEHSTIECQAHSGPDCTECGGTGVWSGKADERAASWHCEDPVQKCRAQCDSCAKQARAALKAIVDERAECIAWANANGFPKYHESMCAAWEERARRAAASPAAEVVRLQHVATAEDGGKLRWMTGRRPRDCELYAMPDGGRAPATLYAAPQPAQADALGEEAYVAKRMTETLATVYATIIGDDEVDTDDGLNAIERVVRAAQVLRLEVDLYRAQADAPDDTHKFKNFHRRLCERFGYVHDEIDWRRDQVSLIEWIAKKADAPAEAREPIAWMTDDDRAITAAQKQRALADGGATASSVRPYSIPCYAVSAPADAGEARLTDAARDMLAERRRQVEAEGWTPEHDDQYQHGAIALAAACYAANAGGVAWADPLPSFWPWMHNWWKPTTPRRDLVKAGALILAELERLDRAALLNGADHDQ